MFSVIQWVVCACAIGVLGWVVRNIWVILYRQGKYKVLPLLTFYVLATLLVLFRIYDAIWNF